MLLSRGKSKIITVVLYSVSCLTWVEAMMPMKLEKSWTYEFKSVEANSSNPDLINFVDWRIDRIGRGIYSTSGSYILNYDVAEGDTNGIEIRSYRSENGVAEYRELPFKVPPQHIFKFFNTFYKEMAMDSLKACSNMPVFEDKFEPPYVRNTYTFDKCQFSQEGYPQHLQDGFYKVMLSGFGDVEWSMTYIVQVERNV